MRLFSWILDMYECSCFCCLEGSAALPDAASACFRLPSPKKLGISAQEFEDWSSMVTCLARKRSKMIRTDMIPRLRKIMDAPPSSSDDNNDQDFAESLQQCLLMCWNMVAVLNMEAVNMLLFYISYPIRNNGEPFVKDKIMKRILGGGETQRCWPCWEGFRQ